MPHAAIIFVLLYIYTGNYDVKGNEESIKKTKRSSEMTSLPKGSNETKSQPSEKSNENQLQTAFTPQSSSYERS